MPQPTERARFPTAPTVLAALLGVLVASAVLGAFSFSFGPQGLSYSSPGDDKARAPTSAQGELFSGAEGYLSGTGDPLAVGSASPSSVAGMLLLLGTAGLLAALAFLIVKGRT